MKPPCAPTTQPGSPAKRAPEATPMFRTDRPSAGTPSPLIARRWFLQQCGVGLGALALGQLLTEQGPASPGASPSDPLAPRQPHYAAKVKRVIFLFMAG